jgi:hypothetical protein
MRAIAWLRRRDRGHRGRLHQSGWMWLRSRNADRLKHVRLIKRVGEAARLRGRPIGHFVTELDACGLNRRDGKNRSPDGAYRLYRLGAHGNRRKHAPGRCHGRNGGTRRDEPRHPIEQSGGIARHARRRREDRGNIGRHAVDDGQACVGVSAVANVDAAVDGGGENDTAALLQRDEVIAPDRIVGRQVRAGDGD